MAIETGGISAEGSKELWRYGAMDLVIRVCRPKNCVLGTQGGWRRGAWGGGGGGGL